jgi:NAD(P)-dependent dehydrogenase (short-subunit alcohol dehydrogenase family)
MTETILITGADKGLGFSLARQFLQAGFHVFAGVYADIQNYTNLSQEYPETLTGVPLDVTSSSSIAGAFRKVSKGTPGLDILINNAGVHAENHGTFAELDFTDRHLEKDLAVNAFGPLRMAQKFLPLLKAGRRKLIVNISSEAGSIGNCWRNAEFGYCMSKAALNMQSKIMQNNLGPQGFKVLAIHPGWMRTDMGGREADISPDLSAQGIHELALREWKPEDAIYMDYEGHVLPW